MSENVSEEVLYKEVTIRAVIAFNDEGEYLIHGSNTESAEQMVKAIAPIWDLNPETEDIQYVEFTVSLPVISLQRKVLIG